MRSIFFAILAFALSSSAITFTKISGVVVTGPRSTPSFFNLGEFIYRYANIDGNSPQIYIPLGDIDFTEGKILGDKIYITSKYKAERMLMNNGKLIGYSSHSTSREVTIDVQNSRCCGCGRKITFENAWLLDSKQAVPVSATFDKKSTVFHVKYVKEYDKEQGYRATISQVLATIFLMGYAELEAMADPSKNKCAIL